MGEGTVMLRCNADGGPCRAGFRHQYEQVTTRAREQTVHHPCSGAHGRSLQRRNRTLTPSRMAVNGLWRCVVANRGMLPAS